jgi:rhomboid protease GluP
MKWKISRYGQQVDERLDRARNFFRTVWSRQRMCPACRALVDRQEKVCPLCNERLSGVAGAGLERFFDLILPEQGRWSMFLLAAQFGGANFFGSIDSYTLLRFGAKSPLAVHGEWWRFITPMFLHAGIFHLAMNSWALYDLGPAVEGIYGRQKFLVLYVFTGIVSFATSFLWHPYGLSVGASGALFGLIGAMIAYGYRHRRGASDSVKNMFVRWAIYGLVFGFTRTTILFWKILQIAAIAAIFLAFAMVGLRQPA